MTTDSLSAGPCCEMNKLIVQIAGRDHSDRQQVLLISPKDDRVYQSRPEKLDHVHYSCILEVWDHIDGAHLHLQIATIDGEPIRLPLLHKTQVTPRQADAQFNQIVPVLPFVPLPGSRTVYDLGTPVLARAGYVYVFYQEKLWRELEIQVSETGSTYHDIDVAVIGGKTVSCPESASHAARHLKTSGCRRSGTTGKQRLCSCVSRKFSSVRHASNVWKKTLHQEAPAAKTLT
ncbi:Uncharacterized protein ALO43_03610 [Pseudomonas tremae]|uniref:Uncharacterized protein n=1 Tax=Pseudomonas tremae TaxID=200454 RepID=A0AA40P909_9PSED|nr:Uncharacterized protein ALO43_03610 [Pseudomonas tremae]RMO07351.1 hypothetical protein ALQ48_00857 [Pseudomonas coronafaciens pv. zizaniae]